MKVSRVASATLFAGLLIPVAAEAKIYKSLVNTGGSEVLSAATYHELSTAGAKTLTFTLNSKRRVAITFSAECGAAPENVVWVGIEIDGVLAKPTDDPDAAFCTGMENTDTATIKGFNTHSVSVVKLLEAGKHKVKLKKALLGPGPGNLEDSTIFVHD